MRVRGRGFVRGSVRGFVFVRVRVFLRVRVCVRVVFNETLHSNT